MPISVRTMRDIWDNERIRKQAEKEMMQERKVRVIPEAVKEDYLGYLTVRKKSLAEIRKHLLDYLERKKYATEIFDFIERDIGKAGFSKV